MSAGPDIRLAAQRLLGLGEVADDRALLGLPASGDVRSGQIEAALEERLGRIARHPGAHSTDARHLALECERAADRMQAEVALRGAGPVHPKAAARAARLISASEEKIAQRAAQMASVVQPHASREVGVGLTAADLTEFDHIALAILVVSGGWNSRSAMRLAGIAASHGVSVDQLQNVVRGLTNYLASGGGFSSGIGEIGHGARRAWAGGSSGRDGLDRAENAVERVLGRINDAIHDEVASGTTSSQARLAAIFGAVAIIWLGTLGWLFFAPIDEQAKAVRPMGEVPELAEAASLPAQGLGGGSIAPEAPARGANGEVIAPLASRAAPAKYPRAPGFMPAPLPATAIQAAGGGPEWIEELEVVWQHVRAARGDIDSQTAALLVDTLAAAGSAWPATSPFRTETAALFGQIAQSTARGEPLRRLMASVPGGDAEVRRRRLGVAESVWHSAYGAGLLCTVALDPAQRSEAAAAAREELRLRSIEIPRGEVQDRFSSGACIALARSARLIADGLSSGSLNSLAEASAWARAVDSATTDPSLRSVAALGAIEAVMDAAGEIDSPGPLVDFLAYSIQILDLSGRTPASSSACDAIAAMLVDPDISAPRAWVLTSLLDADLGIAWYGPDLVIATNADAKARAEIAARMRAAFPKVDGTAIGSAVLVEAAALDEWRKHVALAQGLPDDDAASRLRNAAVAMQALCMARAFENADAKAAKAAEAALLALAGREPAEWNASPTGERFGLPAMGAGDGEFEAAWDSTRDSATRLELVRGLSARPAEGDLGPRDARVVVQEALRSSNQELRQALASLVVSRYMNGRNVLRALLDELADGSQGARARGLLSALLGGTVAGGDWLSDARAQLIERIRVLEDGRWHAEDAAASELSAACGAVAALYGRDVQTVARMRAEAALAVLADVLRIEASSRFAAAAFPAPIDELERRRTVRRAVAVGTAQAMAAESAAIVDYLAALVVSRQPALRSKVLELHAKAVRDRAEARSATAQVQSDLRAALSIVGEGLAPEATRRDA